MVAVRETIHQVQKIDVDQYKYGFKTDIEVEKAPQGLNEDIIRFLSSKKDEPEWMLKWRLHAYHLWLEMKEPDWARVQYPRIDFNSLYYYAAPKNFTGPKSLDEVDPLLLETYKKLGIPLREQEILAGVQTSKVAVDAVFDSVSIVTTFKEELKKAGVIFMSISEAIRKHPELVKTYLSSVVPVSDNFYAALNSAVFTDGSFVYVPKGVRCPMELSTYFRINEKNTGQFERTLIIAEEGSYVSYLEGCTAPQRDENQLHAAVVELVALDNAEIRYSTVQNWYPGDKEGKGGVYNFVTKRGDCRGKKAKISWTQVETGSAITWKYPSCVLRGEGSSGEFYSIAISNGFQQIDSGTKMIHLAKNTTSRVISKGIAAGFSDNTYRGKVLGHRRATGARNFTQCDSLLIGDKCGAHTVPYIEAKNSSCNFEHEATTSKISDEHLFYCLQRGIPEEKAIALIVNGFVKEVLQKLPMEFAVEAQKLIDISLEGSVG
ncbi:Iron-sulfur cluster assembly protein SufB [Liberibacter crescens BT-1]|uniref:Iron-sulfur cluster assembly protein SufB n=1 Tax=Liberibacter crescens (strain BT-1) TaxID=1215343 RepID=L0EWV8_LIBCB|nr:Fe-S cluster assembly protein SufB [Liberibacter crescens]AGA64866.1 Iron-sulfur cluster assembly protein SufB [Liberibacter crescens BT-1]AMC12910.1 cysteine desulfurase [Liberibacter crescens]